MPKRLGPPDGNLIDLKQARRAADGSEVSVPASGYKPFQTLVCRIVRELCQGYSVLISRDNCRASLITGNKYKVGEAVKAMFVCREKGRVILRIRSESYRLGQNLPCTILSKEAGGYEVLIQKDNIHAYLSTPDKLKTGDEIIAVFVCFRNGRAQLTRLFDTPRALKPVAEVKRFERKAVSEKEKISKDSE